MKWCYGIKNISARFFLVLIDKLANIIATFCRYHYVEVVLKEAGITGEENKTYTRSNVRKCEIIEEIVKY